MTGFKLVNKFYLVNLNYLRHYPFRDDSDQDALKLFLLGLIETVYIKDPHNTDPEILKFLNAN